MLATRKKGWGGFISQVLARSVTVSKQPVTELRPTLFCSSLVQLDRLPSRTSPVRLEFVTHSNLFPARPERSDRFLTEPVAPWRLDGRRQNQLAARLLVSPLAKLGNGEAFLGKGGAFRRPWGAAPWSRRSRYLFALGGQIYGGYPQAKPFLIRSFLFL